MTIKSPSLSPGKPECGTTCLGDPCYPPFQSNLSYHHAKQEEPIKKLTKPETTDNIPTIKNNSKPTNSRSFNLPWSFLLCATRSSCPHIKHHFKCTIGSTFSRPRSRSVKSTPNPTWPCTWPWCPYKRNVHEPLFKDDAFKSFFKPPWKLCSSYLRCFSTIPHKVTSVLVNHKWLFTVE